MLMKSFSSFFVLLFLFACNDKPELLPRTNPLNVYPNPVIDVAYITFSNPDNSLYQLQVFDTSGDIIFEKKESVADAEYEVNLSDSRSGTYHVVLKKDDSVFIRKIVKQ